MISPDVARLSERHPTPIVVMQGDVYFTAEPTVLVTVLGSCVAVCLWDRKRGAGGMNHFVLPTDPRGVGNTRYGGMAIDALVDGLLRLGCESGDLRAKVFGGAAVLPYAGDIPVGTSNVRLALGRLRERHIPVTVRRTGGTQGQQIRFHTATGEVLFRQLPRSGSAIADWMRTRDAGGGRF